MRPDRWDRRHLAKVNIIIPFPPDVDCQPVSTSDSVSLGKAVIKSAKRLHGVIIYV